MDGVLVVTRLFSTAGVCGQQRLLSRHKQILWNKPICQGLLVSSVSLLWSVCISALVLRSLCVYSDLVLSLRCV